jgi:hypothetical protein
MEDTIAREISNAEVLARHEDTMREKRKIREGVLGCVWYIINIYGLS